MKLLLHMCCAPCSIYPIDVLRQENIDVEGFSFNPNIHPYKEYEKRLETAKEYTSSINLSFHVIDNYGLVEFTRNVANNVDNRCNYCYSTRLDTTAKYAKESGFDAFSTSLLISPYQKHDEIKSIGEAMAKKYNIDFYYKDFREGFRTGQQKARELGLYMQPYCGCIYSEMDRYMKKR